MKPLIYFDMWTVDIDDAGINMYEVGVNSIITESMFTQIKTYIEIA